MPEKQNPAGEAGLETTKVSINSEAILTQVPENSKLISILASSELQIFLIGTLHGLLLAVLFGGAR